MKRVLVSAAIVAGATMFAAAPAQAGGGVFWSIGINAPLDAYGATIGTTISNAPSWHRPAPVYVQPAPIYYPPAPVYYQRPIFVQPRPIYHVHPYPYHHARPVFVHPGRGHHWHKPHHGHHWKRGDRDDDGRWGHGRGDRRDRWDRHPGRYGRD